MTTNHVPDLVVLSHLRWVWVWQRPQHLISRIAKLRSQQGARTWFVEEPHVGPVDEPVLRQERFGDVTRVWLVVPRLDDGTGNPDLPEFQSPVAASYGDLLRDLLAAEGSPPSPDVWVYTPMALDLLQRLEPGRVVHDIMDDLSGFLDAPEGLALRQRRLINEADVVFTGGRSLHRFAASQRSHGIHLFPSGVDSSHYARALTLRHRATTDRPVAGYVGVIDERLDLDLIGRLADRLPDWTVRMVGPVTKIDPSLVPQRANIEYLGMKSYAELPEIMAGFDVALMPFALNEATRSISPTKTLEYFAAGLPVVSSRVPDVVADYSDLVRLADDPDQFAAACEEAIGQDGDALRRRYRRVLARQEWDTITSRMIHLLDQADRFGPSRSGSKGQRLHDSHPLATGSNRMAHQEATA
jgi:glycosyltransferase involved in cell wall biosynthesis